MTREAVCSSCGAVMPATSSLHPVGPAVCPTCGARTLRLRPRTRSLKERPVALGLLIAAVTLPTLLLYNVYQVSSGRGDDPSPAVHERAATPAVIRQTGLSDDAYPATALRRNEEGTTVARLTIDEDGRLDACEVVESSGSSALDSATCAGFARGRFDPARDVGGRPVKAEMRMPVRWVIPQ